MDDNNAQLVTQYIMSKNTLKFDKLNRRRRIRLDYTNEFNEVADRVS